MNLLKSFCRCVAIDMLGMGESQVIRKDVAARYAKSKNKWGWQYDCWLWVHDSDYIHNFMKKMYPNQQFIFVADDWGGGTLAHYASKYPDDISNQIYIDPVALDGYPVNEIQAVGRAAGLDDKMYQMAMGAFDQTVIQIEKTMVHNPGKVFNQYTYRWILEPYVNVDYVTGFSSTMQLNWNNLRNLSDRSFVLGGPQLLPYSPSNKMGVKYSKMKAQCLIMWAMSDSMMPNQQRHRLRYVINLATKNKVKVQTRSIPDAGHFAGLDQPHLISSNILDYISEQYGVSILADVFLGFKETMLWKGDEKRVISDLRKMLDWE